MKIILKSLKLENFKGIKNLSIDFKDRVTTIAGDNAAGKTTIFDAYCWLLWDKDSLNRKSFGIKPYDKDGQEVHNLESSVEGDFIFGDTELKLKKIYKETWTKKRGSTQSEFTGHTTDYYINSVPIKKKEYTDRIASAVSEDDFNLLSNPLYFNQILDKNRRREILLSMIDEVEPKDIVAKNKDLKDLDLENYTVDELKKMAKDTARKINKDLESIPARIDELNKSRVDTDFKTLEFRKNTITPAIRKIDEELADESKAAEKISGYTEKIAELKAKKLEIISQYQADCLEVKNRNQATKLQAGKDQEAIKEAKEKVEKWQELLEKSREDWCKTYKEQYSGDFKCPTCHQDLPEEEVEAVMKNFNKLKSEKLAEIEEKANILKAKFKECQEFVDITSKKTYRYEELPEEPEDITAIDSEVENLRANLKDSASCNKKDLLDKKAKLQADLDEINRQLSLQGQNDSIDERIADLESKEKDLAKAYEDQQRIIYLCDEYTKTYVDMVSDKINQVFSLAKFKLFERQINGGIAEACEVTIDGVPYGDLNSAAKINAGLDVINSLSKKLDLKVPVFIDNAESVNKLIETDTQLVRLAVSKDKELKIA